MNVPHIFPVNRMIHQVSLAPSPATGEHEEGAAVTPAAPVPDNGREPLYAAGELAAESRPANEDATRWSISGLITPTRPTLYGRHKANVDALFYLLRRRQQADTEPSECDYESTEDANEGWKSRPYSE